MKKFMFTISIHVFIFFWTLVKSEENFFNVAFLICYGMV